MTKDMDFSDFSQCLVKLIEEDIERATFRKEVFSKKETLYQLSSIEHIKGYFEKLRKLDKANRVSSSHSSLAIQRIFHHILNASDVKSSYVYLSVLKELIRVMPTNLDYRDDTGKTILHQLACVVRFIANFHKKEHVDVAYVNKCGIACKERLAICVDIFLILKEKRVFRENDSKTPLLACITADEFVFDCEGVSAADILLDIDPHYFKIFLHESARKECPERFLILDTVLSKYSEQAIDLMQGNLLLNKEEEGHADGRAAKKLAFFENRLLSDFFKTHVNAHAKVLIIKKISTLNSKVQLEPNILNLITTYSGHSIEKSSRKHKSQRPKPVLFSLSTDNASRTAYPISENSIKSSTNRVKQ